MILAGHIIETFRAQPIGKRTAGILIQPGGSEEVRPADFPAVING